MVSVPASQEGEEIRRMCVGDSSGLVLAVVPISSFAFYRTEGQGPNLTHREAEKAAGAGHRGQPWILGGIHWGEHLDGM